MGTSFACLQALTHALQPTHRVESNRNPTASGGMCLFGRAFAGSLAPDTVAAAPAAAPPRNLRLLMLMPGPLAGVQASLACRPRLRARIAPPPAKKPNT